MYPVPLFTIDVGGNQKFDHPYKLHTLLAHKSLNTNDISTSYTLLEF